MCNFVHKLRSTDISVRLQLLAKLRQTTLTSHNKSQLKQHEPSLPNALAKQQRKGRQGKNQLAAVGTKQAPSRQSNFKVAGL